MDYFAEKGSYFAEREIKVPRRDDLRGNPSDVYFVLTISLGLSSLLARSGLDHKKGASCQFNPLDHLVCEQVAKQGLPRRSWISYCHLKEVWYRCWSPRFRCSGKWRTSLHGIDILNTNISLEGQ